MNLMGKASFSLLSLLSCYLFIKLKKKLKSYPIKSKRFQHLSHLVNVFFFLNKKKLTRIWHNLCRAIFDLASKGSFWICLLGIQIAAIVPRFGIKMFMQHCNPSDIQIAREAEKFGNLIESTNQEIEMNTTRRWPFISSVWSSFFSHIL